MPPPGPYFITNGGGRATNNGQNMNVTVTPPIGGIAQIFDLIGPENAPQFLNTRGTACFAAGAGLDANVQVNANQIPCNIQQIAPNVFIISTANPPGDPQFVWANAGGNVVLQVANGFDEQRWVFTPAPPPAQWV